MGQRGRQSWIERPAIWLLRWLRSQAMRLATSLRIGQPVAVRYGC